MHPPSRARRILKWTGAGLSLLILATWCELWIALPRNVSLSIDDGAIAAQIYDIYPVSFQCRVHQYGGPGLSWPVIRIRNTSIPQSGTLFLPHASIPFWLLLLLTAIPTAWLWDRDRRRIRPGCCLRCGYDLTGNTSGVCSECGEKTQTAKPPPAISE